MEHETNESCARCDGCDLLKKLQSTLPSKHVYTTPMLVLYGSETGNAKSIAEKLCGLAQVKHIPAQLHRLDDFEKIGFLDQSPKFCAIVCSTTGNGDAPLGAERFARHVKKRTLSSDTLLRTCQFAVLALGDTNYDKFCYIGKMIDTRLKAIGATQVLPVVLADEVMGLETFVEPWIDNVLKKYENEGNATTAPAPQPQEEEKLSMTVLYGSETGNAKAIAEKLHDLALNKGIDSKLHTLDEYEKLGFVASTEFFAIICSTTGNGDAPIGAEKFLRFVKRRTHAADMLQCSYCVLALGDTNYDKFCHVGKTIDIRIKAIGGRQLLPVVLVDEVLGLEGTVEPWLEQVLQLHTRAAAAAVGASVSVDTVSVQPSPIAHVAEEPVTKPSQQQQQQQGWTMPQTFSHGPQEFTELSTEELIARTKRLGRVRQPIPVDKILANQHNLNFITCKITDKCLLTASGGEDRIVYKITVESPKLGEEIEWTAGDAVGIRTANPPELVKQCAQRLNMHSGAELLALAQHVDLSTTPDRGFLRTLAEHCTDSKDAARMKYLSSFEGKQEYDLVLQQQKLNVLEVLEMFPSCQPIDAGVVFGSLMDAPQPRMYSIASSPLKAKHALDVCFSVVRTKISTERVVCGVCTNALAQLDLGSELQLFVKPNSTFKLPVDDFKPIIMCGPGTGVAPFVGFIQHRQENRLQELLKQKRNAPERGAWRGGLDFEDELEEAFELESRSVSPPHASSPGSSSNNSETSRSTLYFGCRNSQQDFLFERELNGFVASGALGRLRVAFSRPTIGTKQYVQDLMLNEDAAELADQLLNQGAYFYVCGDGTKMARDVQQAICSILTTHGNMTEDEAKTLVIEMQKRGRYVQDIW